MRSGCEIIECPDMTEGGVCGNTADTVNRETGEDMCPRNPDAISRSKWEEAHGKTETAAPATETNAGMAQSTGPEPREYLLTIRVRFHAFDDPDARHKAQVSVAMHGFVGNADYHTGGIVDKKLQRLSKSGPPEKVEL